ncbi:hypothetical protein FACS189428_7280 [Clostridia bacterium]|nr:hypothetical protein FACS189428_7280 [Clostridia bacterium]
MELLLLLVELLVLPLRVEVLVPVLFLLLELVAGAVVCLLSVLAGAALSVVVLLLSVLELTLSPDDLVVVFSRVALSLVLVPALDRVGVVTEGVREVVACRVVVPEADRVRVYSVLIRSLSR